jgi:hypothetical protein
MKKIIKIKISFFKTFFIFFYELRIKYKLIPIKYIFWFIFYIVAMMDISITRQANNVKFVILNVALVQ